MWQPWRWALILKVIRKTFNFRILEQRLLRLWELENRCEMIDINDGYVIVRFYSAKDYTKVMDGGPWMVMGHYLTIVKRRPNFRITDAITSTLIWVRFPKLSIEMFSEKVLFGMGNTMGKTVKIDRTIEGVTKGKYVRLCIELDLNKPLVPSISVYGRV